MNKMFGTLSNNKTNSVNPLFDFTHFWNVFVLYKFDLKILKYLYSTMLKYLDNKITTLTVEPQKK